MSVGVCGRETWPGPLRGQHRLRASGNKVLKRLFGSKQNDKVRETREYDIMMRPVVCIQLNTVRVLKMN
jgi:hypothetical protein